MEERKDNSQPEPTEANYKAPPAFTEFQFRRWNWNGALTLWVVAVFDWMKKKAVSCNRYLLLRFYSFFSPRAQGSNLA